METGSGGTTDATAIRRNKGGMPDMTISPPRCVLCPVEVQEIGDIEAGIELPVSASRIKEDL